MPVGSVYSPSGNIVERSNGSMGGIIAFLRNCEVGPKDADVTGPLPISQKEHSGRSGTGRTAIRTCTFGRKSVTVGTSQLKDTT